MPQKNSAAANLLPNQLCGIGGVPHITVCFLIAGRKAKLRIKRCR
jgi:hypothetical protein